MPEPTDVAAIRRFIGIVNYLAKYLPRLSMVAKPLTSLTCKDHAWTWGPAHKKAVDIYQQTADSTCTTPMTLWASWETSDTVWCVQRWTWSLSAATRPTHHLRKSDDDSCWAKLYSNQEGNLGNHFLAGKISPIHLRMNNCSVDRPQTSGINFPETPFKSTTPSTTYASPPTEVYDIIVTWTPAKDMVIVDTVLCLYTCHKTTPMDIHTGQCYPKCWPVTCGYLQNATSNCCRP